MVYVWGLGLGLRLCLRLRFKTLGLGVRVFCLVRFYQAYCTLVVRYLLTVTLQVTDE